MIHFKDNKNKSPLNTRWAQMTKQEQIIERKKMEIQAKLESQKQAAALAAQAKLANPTLKDDKNIFSNDGSFMNQFKALVEKQKQENEERELMNRAVEVKEVQREEPDSQDNQEHDQEHNEYEERRPGDGRNQRDNQHRWNERGRNHRHSPINDERNQFENQIAEIPSLMQIPVNPPDSNDSEQWGQGPSENIDAKDPKFVGQGQMPPGPMPPCPMPPNMMRPGMMGPGMGPMPNMGPGSMMGPGGSNMPPMPFMGGPPNFPMPPNFMGPNGPRPCGPMPPNMCGPNGPMPPFFGPPFPNPNMMGPNGPPNLMGGPNGPPNSMMGPNGPIMGPNGPPMMGPNGPHMMGPNRPNSMMGPNGPNSIMGPSGPPNSMMGPNRPPNSMMGPNGPPNSMMGPNGPPNSIMGPNGPPNSMMGLNGPPRSMLGSGPNGPPNLMMNRPNGPPNPMMRPNGPPNFINNGNMSMGPRPPFGPSGPNFGPPMPPFMPPTSMQNVPEFDDSDNNPPSPPEHTQQRNQSSMPSHKPKGENKPSQSSQVLSSDSFPASVQAAASEVATNGDHWENVLKAIHTQDPNMWFLHKPNSKEYERFRELVEKLRKEKKTEVKDEDKYEPEFSLEDDDSYDAKPVKEENSNSNTSSNFNFWQTKREHASSQSDEEPEIKTERRKRKKKSRWGNDPPASDIKPPGVMPPLPPGVAPMPPIAGLMPPMPGMMPPISEPMPPMPGTMPPIPRSMPPMPPMPGMMPPIPGMMPPMPGMPPIPGMTGPKLAKIDSEEGLKLTTVNRNNHALMQYAMTNYGTTNLNAEDWKKCEDNFKLNLLYQDMLKKRNEVERLAAAGRHKYEYDSDEDTSEGTWEHRLRSREMNATEKWADELTKQAAGKHHIGDFLPPEELKKFMEKYSAVKGGKEPDLSDYKEFKLKEDNVGFKMLQKLGWSEGQGLGAEGSGIVDPINKANQPVANLGLGANSSDNVAPEDDEFDAYRKRMMLAYRFRPNPLNNPRRPYY